MGELRLFLLWRWFARASCSITKKTHLQNLSTQKTPYLLLQYIPEKILQCFAIASFKLLIFWKA